MNTVKIIREEQPKKVSKNKEQRKNNFINLKTLFLINLKKTVKDKSVFVTGIVFLVFSFIFGLTTMLIPSPFGKLLVNQISYIICLFIFSILSILTTVSVVKKQMLDGIHQIEQRAGLSSLSSIIIRFLIQLIVLWTFSTINFIILLLFSTAENKDNFLSYTLSTGLFYYFFSIFFNGLTIIIAVIFSLSGGITINIFIALIIVLSGVISGVATSVTNRTKQEFGDDVARLNASINLGNNFYQEFKEIDFLFGDKVLKQVQKNSNTQPFKDEFFKDLNEKNWVSERGTNYYFYEHLDSRTGSWTGGSQLSDYKWSSIESTSYTSEIILRAMKFGQFAVPIFSKNDETHYVLENLEFVKQLKGLFAQVEEADRENNKNLKVIQPGSISNIFVEYNEGEDINIDPMIKFLINENKDKDIKELLKWTQKIYNNYKTALSQDNYYKPFFGKLNASFYIHDINVLMGSKTLERWNKEENELFYQPKQLKEFKRAMQIYAKYPELSVISAIMFNAWVNSLYIQAPGVHNLKDFNHDEFGQEYWGSNYEEYIKFNKINLNWNLLNHFSLLYSGIYNNKNARDIMFQQSSLGYKGNITWYDSKKIEDLSSYMVKHYDNNPMPVKQLPYKEINFKKSSNYQMWALYLMYILVSLLLVYLASIVFRWKSKI